MLVGCIAEGGISMHWRMQFVIALGAGMRAEEGALHLIPRGNALRLWKFNGPRRVYMQGVFGSALIGVMSKLKFSDQQKVS